LPHHLKKIITGDEAKEGSLTSQRLGKSWVAPILSSPTKNESCNRRPIPRELLISTRYDWNISDFDLKYSKKFKNDSGLYEAHLEKPEGIREKLESMAPELLQEIPGFKQERSSK
jgi:hypothetical protein